MEVIRLEIQTKFFFLKKKIRVIFRYEMKKIELLLKH